MTGRRARDDASWDDLDAGELPPHDDVAATLPESLRIDIDLPAPVRVQPPDEAAVAIPDRAVNPGAFATTGPLTHSVSIVTVPSPVEAHEAPARRPAERIAERIAERGTVDGPEPRRSAEVAAALTPERLIDERRMPKPRPDGAWARFVWRITFHAVRLPDSKRVRERRALDARITRELEGGTRFVPVLTRKGGVGKTTVTTLLGMALATTRDDRVIAIDANPDRGTLAERVAKQTRSTVRDVVTKAAGVHGYTDFSTLVSRDATRLDVLASDTDPQLAEAFGEDDYNVVADLAARYYSIALTDCGTGIVHGVMRATLQRADSIVVVSGGSVDEARLASETLTWLEANGYAHLVAEAVVVLNTATHGTNLVKLDELDAHFRSRVREVVRIPYDPELAAGSVIDFRKLKPLTVRSVRQLAALVVDGLPTRRG